MQISLMLITTSPVSSSARTDVALFEKAPLCCVRRYTACKAFLSTLNETNDYAGQHEVISENMTSQITVELARYVQELKQERKSVTPNPLCLPKRRTEDRGYSPRNFKIR